MSAEETLRKFEALGPVETSGPRRVGVHLRGGAPSFNNNFHASDWGFCLEFSGPGDY